jgi:hypothetical protein
MIDLVTDSILVPRPAAAITAFFIIITWCYVIDSFYYFLGFQVKVVIFMKLLFLMYLALATVPNSGTV